MRLSQGWSAKGGRLDPWRRISPLLNEKRDAKSAALHVSARVCLAVVVLDGEHIFSPCAVALGSPGVLGTYLCGGLAAFFGLYKGWWVSYF